MWPLCDPNPLTIDGAAVFSSVVPRKVSGWIFQILHVWVCSGAPASCQIPPGCVGVCVSIWSVWRSVESIIIKELGWKSSYKWVRLKHTQRPVVVQIRSAESPGWRQNQHFYVMLKSLVELNSVNLKYTSANLRNKEPPGACFLRMTSVQFVLLSCAGG